MKNKYEEFDKLMSQKIMKEFDGKEIEHICPHCNGSGKWNKEMICEDCSGSGTITIQY